MSLFGFGKKKKPTTSQRHKALAAVAAASVAASGAHAAIPPKPVRAQPVKPLSGHQTGLERVMAVYSMHVRMGASHEQAMRFAFGDMIDQLTMHARKERVLRAGLRLLADWLYR